MIVAGVVAQHAVAPRDLAVVAVLGPDERLDERVPRRLAAGHQPRELAPRVQAVGRRDDRVEPVAPAQLVLGEAEQLAALAVDELHAAPRVEHDDQRRRHLEVALRAVPLLRQPALRLDRRGHVRERHDHARTRTGALAQRPRVDPDPLLAPHRHAADRPALVTRERAQRLARTERPPVALVDDPEVRQERRGQPAGEVLVGEIQDPQGRRVPGRRAQRGIRDDHTLFKSFNNDARERLGLMGRLTCTRLTRVESPALRHVLPVHRRPGSGVEDLAA